MSVTESPVFTLYFHHYLEQYYWRFPYSRMNATNKSCNTTTIAMVIITQPTHKTKDAVLLSGVMYPFIPGIPFLNNSLAIHQSVMNCRH